MCWRNGILKIPNGISYLNYLYLNYLYPVPGTDTGVSGLLTSTQKKKIIFFPRL